MADAIKQSYRYNVKVQVVPNYGLVYLLDRGLQKQLDDLNEMKAIRMLKRDKNWLNS